MRLSITIVALVIAFSLGGCFEGPPVGPGERLVSVTCPGGTIHIEEIADSSSASCIGASGPALALCVRQ